MLGGSCSPCCECSNDERYAIWQRLRASTCTISASILCERQHAATSLYPGFANGGQGVKNKYFPLDATALSGFRLFYRPTPILSGSYELSVDLSGGSTYFDGGRGAVQWKIENPDMSITVAAFVGIYDPYGQPSNPALDENKYKHYPFQQSERCDVWYAVSANVFVYSFYARSGKHDPSPFSETAYSAEYEPGLTFTRYLASAGAPIASIRFGLGGDLETGFAIGTPPGPSEDFRSRTEMLNGWWQTYGLNIPDQVLVEAYKRAANTGVFSLQYDDLNFIDALQQTMAKVSRKYLYRSESDTPGSAATSGSLTASYLVKPGQWLTNDTSSWLKELSFTPYWNMVYGGLMSVQGSVSDYKYTGISADTFECEFDVSFAEQ
jgi:hypothetical protein